MTVIATPNNPTGSRSFRHEPDREPKIWQAHELYRGGHPEWVGEYVPNAGDMVDLNNGRYLDISSIDFTTFDWVAEEKEGDVFKAMHDYKWRLAGGSTESSMVHVQTKTRDADAGLAARAKAAARKAAARTARMIRWSITAAISLTIIAAAVIATYGYKTMEIGRDSFERTCTAKLSNGTEVTGRRGYVQKYREVFGFKIANTREAYEKTTLDVRGAALTVVGQYTKTKPVNPEDNSVPAPEERWWGAQMEAGDKERLVLKGADNYTFVMGKGVAVVKYEEFCKG